jgi:hypothetical protein
VEKIVRLGHFSDGSRHAGGHFFKQKMPAAFFLRDFGFSFR